MIQVNDATGTRVNVNSKPFRSTKKTKRRSGGRTGRRTKEMLAIAKNRMKILMQLAEHEAIENNNHPRARRYVQMARNLGTRYNISLDKEYNNKICRSCNTFLGSEQSGRTRVRCGRVIITCKNCGRIKRLSHR